MGTYDDGSPKHMYFRRRKHRMKRHSIRYYIWVAKQWMINSTLNY